MSKKLKIKDLTPDDKNFNKGSEFGNSLIEKSFRKFGAGRSILIDKNNRIIAGNKSIENAAAIGMDEIEVIESDGTKIIAVKRTDIDLDSEIGREMALADNASAKANIVFDAELIEAEVGEAVAVEWGIELEKEIPIAEEDDFDVPNEIQTDIVLGDLFEIGEHRLLCGDSTDSDAVAKLMNGQKADSCITSPPYNQGGGSGDLFSHGKRVESLYENDFDNKSKEEYFEFCISILNNILLILNKEHSVVWNISYNAKSRDDYGKIIFSELNPFSVKETILWNKGGSINLPQAGIYSRKVEFVFVMSNYDKYLTSQIYGDCRWNLWETTKVNQLSNHKATFSIEFAEKAINELTLLGSLIYEPFTGSGTTMVASHQLKRKCYGMELDPKYCQVIVDRMIKLDSTLEIKKNGVKYESKQKS